MAEVTVTDEIATSADSLWEMLSNFADLSWSPSVENCTLEGEGVGAVRTFFPKGSPTALQERLDAMDAATMTYAYSFVGENPMPCENYRANVKISSLGADRCRIEWRGSFEPKGLPEEKVSGIFEGIYRSSIAAYKKRLEKK